MNIDEILDLWEKDSDIDRSELGEESLKTSKLHHKYFKIYSKERLILKKLESDLKVLRMEKQEFYIQGPTKEQLEKGWKLPSIGKILKSDVNTYIESDKDYINLSLKIGLQQEKIELLQSIIDVINRRSFHIKNAIEWTKWINGGV